MARFKPFSLIWKVGLLAFVAGAGFMGYTLYQSGKPLIAMLKENQELRQAITNLSQEEQIGYAKVLQKTTDTDGNTWTHLKFVETNRKNKQEIILEKEYTLDGDIIHFDALIVKFLPPLVQEGKERAMYLWRRVYGEGTAPQDGQPIEEQGAQPKRYADFASKLNLVEKKYFWSEIWKLASEPERLAEEGVRAIHGTAVYQKLIPGFIYVFKITPTGQVDIESIPDI